MWHLRPKDGRTHVPFHTPFERQAIYVRQTVKDFLEELKYTKAPNTAHVYEEHLRKFLRWMKERDISFDEVSFRDIRDFRNDLCERLAPRSVNAILAALRSFFSFLQEEGVVEENPVRTGKLSLKEPELPPDYMSDEEIEKVFSYMRKNFPENVVAAFETQLATGLRVSEVAALTGDDVVVLQGRLLSTGGKGKQEKDCPRTDPASGESSQLKGKRIPFRRKTANPSGIRLPHEKGHGHRLQDAQAETHGSDKAPFGRDPHRRGAGDIGAQQYKHDEKICLHPARDVV